MLHLVPVHEWLICAEQESEHTTHAPRFHTHSPKTPPSTSLSNAPGVRSWGRLASCCMVFLRIRAWAVGGGDEQSHNVGLATTCKQRAAGVPSAGACRGETCTVSELESTERTWMSMEPSLMNANGNALPSPVSDDAAAAEASTGAPLWGRDSTTPRSMTLREPGEAQRPSEDPSATRPALAARCTMCSHVGLLPLPALGARLKMETVASAAPSRSGAKVTATRSIPGGDTRDAATVKDWPADAGPRASTSCQMALSVVTEAPCDPSCSSGSTAGTLVGTRRSTCPQHAESVSPAATRTDNGVMLYLNNSPATHFHDAKVRQVVLVLLCASQTVNTWEHGTARVCSSTTPEVVVLELVLRGGCWPWLQSCLRSHGQPQRPWPARLPMMLRVWKGGIQ